MQGNEKTKKLTISTICPVGEKLCYKLLRLLWHWVQLIFRHCCLISERRKMHMHKLFCLLVLNIKIPCCRFKILFAFAEEPIDFDMNRAEPRRRDMKRSMHLLFIISLAVLLSTLSLYAQAQTVGLSCRILLHLAAILSLLQTVQRLPI